MKPEEELMAEASITMNRLATPVKEMIVVNAKIENIVDNQRRTGLAINIGSAEVKVLDSNISNPLLIELLRAKAHIFKQMVEILNIENIKIDKQ